MGPRQPPAEAQRSAAGLFDLPPLPPTTETPIDEEAALARRLTLTAGAASAEPGGHGATLTFDAEAPIGPWLSLGGQASAQQDRGAWLDLALVPRLRAPLGRGALSLGMPIGATVHLRRDPQDTPRAEAGFLVGARLGVEVPLHDRLALALAVDWRRRFTGSAGGTRQDHVGAQLGLSYRL